MEIDLDEPILGDCRKASKQKVIESGEGTCRMKGLPIRFAWLCDCICLRVQSEKDACRVAYD